ncbi:hypothetical protein HanRHA438_Chr09g0384241 [Helianthus annuus]|uniref:Uncharacterized protein n=1 Tax=Helianthus annuus TaxID=4232 RepID=A0A9K3I483_HELAN|nr:hypothetical protein HanXRQr2_Chr09g0372321 [Helianthus annuus]KAJ0532858.1 hypothetical protein HanIR_Chr09g0401691 [Helianthus annuus]KAJ0541264.1 hypothetical protein HanHA89_Chr09g0326451 [Helianthus annuus]KAJ0706346.1 hypothetical protein HanLR1_Chr09g0305951 [Helianthus annuus]KAJ0752300.1 hypothetical protein HanPI659440_Chr09g0322761 [Helianthus annuus]
MILDVYENTCELGLARNRVTMVIMILMCYDDNVWSGVHENQE